MHGYLPSPAARAEPPDWTRLLTNALAVVKIVPTEQVCNALAMMRSYAAASPTLFINLTRGERDVKEYVALLIALDDVVNTWPLRLRQLLAVPAVAMVSEANGLRRSLLTVPVEAPRGEALVFLLNVAIAHVENGLGYVARVRADTSTTQSVSTPLGSSTAAPNQNAKVAAQHFRQAVEALRWADALHPAPASPSAIALQQLRGQLPLDAARGVALMCAAVAKYMYALSSASTKGKPDTLATLAFEAAQVPLPSSVLSGSSLQLLPSLLLAAYHLHKATWYYAHAHAKGPEMADALGHVRYADTLLRTCNAQWSVEEAHTEATQESHTWWGQRLMSLVSKAARATQKGNAAKHPRTEQPRMQQPMATPVEASADDINDDTNNASLKPATRYPHLHTLVLGELPGLSRATMADRDAPPAAAGAPGAADVVEVFPYVRHLMNDVCAVLQQYEKENCVVYFAKVATPDAVQRDVPDVSSRSGANAGVTQVAEGGVFEARGSLFSSLPSPAALQAALAEQEEVGQAQLALSRALQRLERDRRQLSVYVTPTAALEQALDALEALLPTAEDWANPKGAVAMAVDAVDAAFQGFKKTATEWQEAHDVYVGESCPPHSSVQEAEREVVVWTERATAALAQWAVLQIPSTVASRAAFVESLVPRSAEMKAYLEQVEGMDRDVRDVLAAEPGTVTQAQVQSAVEALEKVKLTGTELITAAASAGGRVHSRPTTTTTRGDTSDAVAELCVSPQYDKAEMAVLAVVDALQEAPMVVAHMEHFTAQLTAMQQRTVTVPLGRERNVVFRATAANNRTSGRKKKKEEVDCRAQVTSALPKDAAPLPSQAAQRGIIGLQYAAESSTPSAASSRKRARDGVDSPVADSIDSDVASVSSSQLGDAEEVAPTPGEGVTQAVVSRSLLSRMRANKAKRQAGASAAAAKAEKSRAKR
jgi:hypothetical protein